MKKFHAFSLSDVVFIMLINVKIPTIVGILTFTSRINFVLSWFEHEKSFITSVPGWTFCWACFGSKLFANVIRLDEATRQRVKELLGVEKLGNIFTFRGPLLPGKSLPSLWVISHCQTFFSTPEASSTIRALSGARFTDARLYTLWIKIGTNQRALGEHSHCWTHLSCHI